MQELDDHVDNQRNYVYRALVKTVDDRILGYNQFELFDRSVLIQLVRNLKNPSIVSFICKLSIRFKVFQKPRHTQNFQLSPPPHKFCRQ